VVPRPLVIALVSAAMLGGAATVASVTARGDAAPVAQEGSSYDGRFTFTRVRYGGAYGFRRGGGASWSHDYPDADRHISQILQYVSTVQPVLSETGVLTLEDPEIFKYPILYISEPGFWSVSDEGARNLRSYLVKGGFLIFDDFENEQWNNMESQLKRAIPEYDFVEIGPDHPVFTSFFRIDDIYVPHPLLNVRPKYYAIFENNDPNRRVMVLANWNADIAEYWEWSDRAYLPVDLSNEAYKLGVNYLIYGLTH
jgi:hypothetical protein